MADAWSTVVTREPEYDDFSRSQIFALMAWESRICPSCRNFDTLVPAGKDERTAITPDGRVFEVQMHRCLACGVEELVRREWREVHKDDRPSDTGALASDGLLFIARPEKEDTDA